MSTIKTYTAIDFERYHNGSMPAHEMHALEKAALNDPFLAAALDGFIHTNTPVADVAMLRQQLQQKNTQQKKGLLLNIRWWQAAAACLLFGGLAWLFYSLNATEKIPNVAQNTTTKPQNTTVTPNNIKPNDTPVTTIDKVNTVEPQINKTDKIIKEAVSPTAASTDMKPAPAPIVTYDADEVAAYKDKQATAAAEKLKQDADNAKAAKKIAAPPYELKGIVTNEQGVPLANATVKSLNSNNATTTDDKGYYQLKNNNAVENVVVNANGYNNATTNVSANQLNNIVLQNNYNQAIQGKTNGVNIAQAEQKLEEDVTVKQKNINIVTPLDHFNKYVAENLKPIVDKEGNTQKGTVTVHFKVDKKGRPYRISVKNTTCKACNNQAITFVKEGPSWPAKQPQTVTIVF
ncbi:carboxypeptidase-like regulatory domain-containing protein [Ferruginibacter yonginensis]|uniref:Carboxypeptidase-like regulatory domain-containing protein n=1 Tax=Ferruginibacter yonginensis TaxID=1310416 RepID=A0ABV8QSW3_9BACT